MPGHSVDQRVAWRDVSAGETYFFHADLQGSVQAVVDSSGALAAQYVYTPFGAQAPLDATGNPFRYAGRRYDPESGLYYYRARYYDAAHGRFLQTDPVGYADQMNLYTYVANDPLNMTDPTGMRKCPKCYPSDAELKKARNKMEKYLSTPASTKSFDHSTRQLEVVGTGVTVLPAALLLLPEVAGSAILVNGIIGGTIAMGGDLANQFEDVGSGGNFDPGRTGLRGAEGFTVSALFKFNQKGLAELEGRTGLGSNLGASVITAYEAGGIVGLMEAGYAWATDEDSGQAGGMGLINGTVGGLLAPLDGIAPGSSTVVNDQIERQVDE